MIDLSLYEARIARRLPAMVATSVQTVQVTCIILQAGGTGNEHITHIGGSGWLWTREQVIAELESSNCRYEFFTLENGKRAVVGVNHNRWGKYLQTHADNYWNNNLLALDRCR